MNFTDTLIFRHSDTPIPTKNELSERRNHRNIGIIGTSERLNV